MELAPVLQQRTRLQRIQVAAWGQELVIRWHDNDERERHYRANEHSRDEPTNPRAHEPCTRTSKKADQRQRRLQPSSSFVARSPLACGDTFFQPHSWREFAEVEVQR